MLTKNVYRGALFYNTWEALVLLQVNTVVSRQFASAAQRFKNKVLFIVRSSFLEQFRTQGFLRIKSTAVQRCARKSTESASGSKIVDQNREEMENSSVTQGSTHRGFC